jgi:hypothetical protein
MSALRTSRAYSAIFSVCCFGVWPLRWQRRWFSAWEHQSLLQVKPHTKSVLWIWSVDTARQAWLLWRLMLIGDAWTGGLVS